MKLTCTLILLLSTVAAISCGKSYSGKKQPVAVKGVLDLRDWDFEKDGPVELKGQAELYWEKIVTPKQKSSEMSEMTCHVKIPGSWTGEKCGKIKIPDYGFGTLRLMILLKKKEDFMAFKIQELTTAYKMYVNGKLITKDGTFGVTRESSIPGRNPHVALFDSDKNIEVILHVSNFYSYVIGLWTPVHFGNGTSIIKLRERKLVLDIFLFGCIIIISFYHLSLFLLRTEEKSNLYFFLFCLLMSIWTVTLNEIYISNVKPYVTWAMSIKLIHLSYMLGISSFVFFVWSLFPIEFSKKIRFIVLIIGIICSLFIIFTPVRIGSKIISYYFGFMLFIFIYCIYVMVKAIQAKRKGAMLFFIGYVVLVISSLHDISNALGLTKSGIFIIQFGTLIFIFIQSIILSQIFSNSFKVNKKLVDELSELNLNLEKKVGERTQELEDANHKLVQSSEVILQTNQELKERNSIIEKELLLARKIQEELIPENSPVNYIYTLYKPMEQVGGDFYDFIAFRDSDNIGIFLSDVSGHGVAAAFITSMIKTIILQSGNRKQNPAELLCYINEVISEQTTGYFVTAFYCIYNPSNQTIIYSNAGHNPPFIIEDEITELQGCKSAALGMFSNNMLQKSNKNYENFEEKLSVGSKILLYTDGLTETRPLEVDKYFEESNMFDVLLENRKLPSEKFINNLYKELLEFRKGNTFEDDICMICLDVLKGN